MFIRSVARSVALALTVVGLGLVRMCLLAGEGRGLLAGEGRGFLLSWGGEGG